MRGESEKGIQTSRETEPPGVGGNAVELELPNGAKKGVGRGRREGVT